MEHPLVIAHRGASGYRPEHTLAAYQLALDLGADVVEPDLVVTGDGVLVCRHDDELSATTDVASRAELAGRRTTRRVDGVELTGWFTEDLTLAELRSLRAVERRPERRPGAALYDGVFGVPTFAEVLTLLECESGRRGRPLGVCPELKHPTHFAEHGLRVDDLLADELAAHRPDPLVRVAVQCFEPATLRRLRGRVDAALLQLVDDDGTFDDLMAREGLRSVATYADVLGAPTSLVLGTDLVADAHAAGLRVHVWTLRDDDHRSRAGAIAEHEAVLRRGVDGVFCDFPDTGVTARGRWLAAAAQPA